MEVKDTKYGENDLVIMWQQDYINLKQEEYTTRKQQKDKGKEKKEEVCCFCFVLSTSLICKAQNK